MNKSEQLIRSEVLNRRLSLKDLSFHYLQKAENLFGKSSKDYPFSGIIEEATNPETTSYVRPRLNIKSTGTTDKSQIPNCIFLTKDCFKDENEKLRIFDLTHEIIHILSGTDDTGTINLEEGLGYYFCEICMKEIEGGSKFFDDRIKPDDRIKQNADYYNAFLKVTDLVKCDEHAIRKLRGLEEIEGTTKGIIKKEYFEKAGLEEIPEDDLIEFLVKDFPQKMT